MKEKTVSFEKILENSNMQELKKAATYMHQVYEIFIEAGFSASEAMTLIVTLMRNCE